MSTTLELAGRRALSSSRDGAELCGGRRRGKERLAERHAKPKLQIGVNIPARGLRWVNVDLSKRELHVSERADEYKQLGRPKSGAAERTVPLTPM
jgi:integrase